MHFKWTLNQWSEVTEEVRLKANQIKRHAALFVNFHPVEISKKQHKNKQKTEDVGVATDSMKLL